MTYTELAALFRALGAPDPDGWARSQVEEGIPQLARFLFLRQAWRLVVDEDDPTWMERRIQRARQAPSEPFAGTGAALDRLRTLGASDADIVDVVRGMQAELIFELCYLLDDPGELEAEVPPLGWALAQLDGDDEVVGVLRGLHESVLETDPTGRQMRPVPPPR